LEELRKGNKNKSMQNGKLTRDRRRTMRIVLSCRGWRDICRVLFLCSDDTYLLLYSCNLCILLID
jgi:hypothetical protein